MNLGQYVEVLVLIHRGLVGLIDENVVLFTHFLDLVCLFFFLELSLIITKQIAKLSDKTSSQKEKD